MYSDSTGRRILANAISLVTIGFTLGAMLAIFAPIILNAVMDRYDQMYPVLDAQIVVTSQQDDEIEIRMFGDKRRSCIYVGLNAYVPGPRETLGSRVFLRRVDTPETGETRPIGALDMGLWKIWPIAGAKSVELYAQHVCTGRIVTTQIARLVYVNGKWKSAA